MVSTQHIRDLFVNAYTYFSLQLRLLIKFELQYIKFYEPQGHAYGRFVSQY